MLKMDRKMDNFNNPSIMEPMESLTLVKDELSDAMKPDIINDTELRSIPFIHTMSVDPYEGKRDDKKKAFLLMDGNENLHVSTVETFCKRLKCNDTDKIKVVSIFGNTGDGKSHTMNHTFFKGEEVFETSPEQNSCTIGVFAAMQHQLGIICLDTEGLLGTTSNNHRRMRMLLKILAISDIVIFRTRAGRLHCDMYDFLGTASKAFCSHFAQALHSLTLPGTTQTLGPAVIIFHETNNTKPLESTISESAEDKLREEFSRLNMDINAFSSLRYIGIDSTGRMSTDYSKLFSAIRMEIENTAVRSPRQPSLVFKAMKALNKKFSGEITERPINPFPEQYFTCTVVCESCNRRCQRSMGHIVEGENHLNSSPCIYQHQYENKVYLCKVCHTNGREVVVTIRAQSGSDSSWYGIAKYAWKGSVIECQNCGEIYRSRQYWYGNKSPEDAAVRSDIIHVWKGGNITAKGPVHSAQMVIDGVSYITGAISSIGSQPTKLLSDWVADKVAPTYWKPNSDIKHCHACKKSFEKTGLPKHHCRGCGEGFCNTCSQNKMPVPSRGWSEPVRVCNDCRTELLKKPQKEDIPEEVSNKTNINIDTHNLGPGNSENSDIIVRKYGETIFNTLTSVASVLEYPKDLIKDTARPAYWVPDSEAPRCYLCETLFGTAEELEKAQFSNTPKKTVGDCRRHHCRSCGQAVCETCSMSRKPVPEKGWLTDVRVCDECINLDKTKTD